MKVMSSPFQNEGLDSAEDNVVEGLKNRACNCHHKTVDSVWKNVIPIQKMPLLMLLKTEFVSISNNLFEIVPSLMIIKYKCRP